MIKRLLLTSALAAAAASMSAQLINHLQVAQPFADRHIPVQSTGLHKGGLSVATANCVDTNYYIGTKNYYKNPSQNYYTFTSVPTGTASYSGGFSYANSGTLTVTGLGFLGVKRPGSTSATVPTKLYLYSVSGTGVPVAKIDSANTSVGAAVNYYYGTLTAPRTMTTNFAVVVKNASAVATDTIRFYMSAANTSTATTLNFGERRGYIGLSNTSFLASNSAFGGSADYEPVVFPIYSYAMTANYTVTPSSPICITSTLSCTNTSINSAVAENYMFNVSRFCKKWGVTATGLDSAYVWNFSDGTGRFTNKNQTHVYSPAGTFNDSLIVSNYAWSYAPNCIDRKVTPITVVAQPTVLISPATSTICTGATATLTASGATSYAWQGGQSVASATYAPSSNSTYTVTGTNACGTATASANVAISAVAVINAASSSAAICAGQSSTLTVSGASTYTWSPSASLSSANGSTVVSTPASTTVYTVTGTSTCGTASTTVTQSVTALPSVTVAASSSSVCSGASVTFTASGASTYSWMPGGASTSTISVAPASSSTYTVMGTASGCTGTKTVAVTVSPNPTVTASASSATICSGATTTLTATGNGVGYLWSTGALTPVVSVSPTVTTTYTVGTASASSCTASANVVVTVNTCTGIDELSANSVSVFPNPSTGILNISVSSEMGSNAAVQIFDALGKLVIAQSLSGEHTVVNTASLSNGIYIYKVLKADQPVKIGRMIKQ